MSDYGSVTCPHCGAEREIEPCDGDGDLVTYWGDDLHEDVWCSECDRTFAVREYVTRAWEAVRDE